MLNLESMGKVELRAACKVAGINYGKLNNDGMRAALAAQPEVAEEAPVEESVLDVNHAESEAALADAGTTSQEFHAKPELVEVAATVTGLKIEKDRPEQNGIKRPSAGGKCRAVWDALDALQTELGTQPTSKQVKVLADTQGWNSNNASIEFYQWRKFNGITGRAAKVA